MEEFIYWIVFPENKVLRIIWIDDVFLPPDDAKKKGYRLSFLGHNWIDSFLDNYQDEDPDSLPNALPIQAGWLLAIKNACEKKNVGFGVTSFAHCHQHIDEFNAEKTLFLIDIENLYAENSELYGYEFVKKTQIPRQRLKYYTRNRATMGRARQLYFPDISDRDYITPDTDTKRLEQWIDSFLIHYDPLVSLAIEFYSKPWVENWGYEWKHGPIQDLNKKCLSEFKEFAPALDLSIDDLSADNSESVKSLLMWRGNGDPFAEWDVAYPHQNSRKLQIKVLKAVCNKLQIPLTSYISEDKWIRVPCEPFLPFLVSLRSLYSHMEREGRPPEKITLDKISSSAGGFDVYMLSIELKDNSSNDPWGLADGFYSHERQGQNTTTRHLRALVSCRTLDISPGIDITKNYLRFFKNGTKRPVVSIYFGPYYIHIVWTGIIVD